MKCSIISILIIIIPTVLGFIFNWNLLGFTNLIYTLSIFAFSSILHFLLQVLFSILNHRKIEKNKDKDVEKNKSGDVGKNKDGGINNKKIGVQITGWKEESELFRKCLISIKNQSIQPNYILFCSDGNENDDQYLFDIYKEVFPNSEYINLQNTLKDDISNIKHILQFKNSKYICISQPHKGKRYAMYSQMKILIEFEMDYILLIDSDTIVKNNGLEMLLNNIEENNADSVTGDVKIYNIVNLLSFLISLKYWYAFNIERAAQSFFENVSCIAGPFGLYKVESLKLILEDWINQKFLGKECTFGDDRNLTNLILQNMGKTLYTHKAICYTDTPISLKRFISQQTRWGKSFIREYFIYFKWNKLSNNQKWLFYDLSFMYIYSSMFTIYAIILHITFKLEYMLIFLFTILVSTIIRSLVAVYFTKELSHLVFSLYSYVYLLILIPLKTWSGITINITSWGTGNRLIKSSILIDILPVFIWNIFLLSCYIIAIYREIDNISLNTIIFFILNSLITIISVTIYFLKKNIIFHKFIKEIEENII